MGSGRGDVWVAMPRFVLIFIVAAEVVSGGCSGDVMPVLFNFGDSNSDTGGIAAGLGYRFPLPDGRVFFGRSTGRLCDGRLVIDFLCESLKTSYLSPYLESLGSDFRNGANFAIAGSKTLPRDRPFALDIQVQQFLHFRSRSLELITHRMGSRNLISEEGFRRALYTIDIGQNDLADAMSSILSYDRIIGTIPAFIAEIRAAIMTLYGIGGRKFWIHNTGPLGCLPQKLALPRKDDSDLDKNGCLKAFNSVAMEFNNQLSILCDEMSAELKNATIVYTDIYSIKYDLIANYIKYGFEKPLMACCGFGGAPYNYNPNISCLNSGYQACLDGSKYISWDGVHYTEAANAIVASKILTTEYSKPKLNFDYFCRD
ncbi:GDSL esterase/lipase At1g09390-like isoform X2 [Typha latifolia]|uniref:GDSL esterase/lipase At1g09390-like isoform X2 n=1 Tax=Typha latifolia TaxID=4733 RepID=UPI003C2CC362